MTKPTPDERIARLSRASVRTVVEPDVDVPGHLGAGRVLPDELLSVRGLDSRLTSSQRAQLSREEVAAVLDLGIRFEAVLMMGLCLELAVRGKLGDPRSVFALHEIGEESRHSRLFLRVIEQLQPTGVNPLIGRGRLGRWLAKRCDFAIIRHPALFNTLVLAGEEIPDLFQKLASEHPETDPFFAAVSRYHRAEEARHLSFARLRVAEVWQQATRRDRWAVRHLAPVIIYWLFHCFVHPGVYEAVGLPKWRTWRAVRRSAARRELQHRAARPVLAALTAGGVFSTVPRRWRWLCNVDGHGAPPARQPAGDDAPGPEPMP